MRKPLILAGLLPVLCAWAPAAQAATTRYGLTAAWTRIATAGATVDVQNVSGVGAVLTTANGTPAGFAGSALGGGEHRVLTLTTDLYAASAAGASVVVMDGIAAAGGAAAVAGTPVEGSSAVSSLSGLNLLDTVAASSRAGWWFVQNQSGVPLTVALDDGAGNALSVFVMAPGGAGQQGASMGSADTGPHTGRIRVYGPAGSQHALRVQ